MARPIASGILVGRSDELATLERMLARAVAGSAGGLLVGGEAGIGKTRLLAELAARAEREGALVLTGQCVGLEEAAIPLLPITDALARLGADGHAPAELAGPDAEPWAALTDRTDHGLFIAVGEQLRRLSASAPVLFGVEDVHWADRSTLDLLILLLRRLSTERMLVAVTYRSDELDRHDDLRRFLADAAREAIVERLELAPLTRAEAAAQLAAILGAQPDPRWADAICARADGNPLFVEELAALAPGAGELPLTLRDMLLARLDRLEPASQAVVRTAAAAGRRVPHGLLARAVELPERSLSTALRAAVREHILVPAGDGYAFRHALLQEASYGQLLPGERALLHATFARALEERPDLASGNAATVAAEIAHHWQRAGDKQRALAAGVRAGVEAQRLRAPAEACDHFTRALALWDEVPGARDLAGMDRATLLERAADAAGRSGRSAHAVELVEAAIAIVDAATEPVLAGLLHERRGQQLWYEGRDAEAAAAYEQAVALVPADPASAERARVLARAGLMFLLTGRPANARVRCEEAIAVAQAVGARAEEAEALLALGGALDPLGDPDAAIYCLRRARDLARAAGATLIEARAAINLSHSLRRHGTLEEALDVALEGTQVYEREGLHLSEASICLANAAEAAFELGRWELADSLTRRLLERGGDGITRAGALHRRATLELARGDLDGAAAGAVEQRALIGEAFEAATALAELEAELALWRGRPDVAARRAAERAGAAAANDPLSHAELVALALRAEADAAAIARARRDASDAASAIARARALRDSVSGPTPPGRRHAALRATIEAELTRAEGRSDAGAWEAAARSWEEPSIPYRAAYARWRQAEALLSGAGGRAAAVEVLGGAHAVAEQLGARLLAEEIAALARRARIELAAPAGAERETSAGPGDELGLTPREREVLDHLALGHTNRQIAEDLFISIKTAGVHVSHILGKLGVSTRGEAAAVARRLGLVA